MTDRAPPIEWGNLRDKLRKAANEAGIPGHMHDVLIEYIMVGTPPGGFLSFVLMNDFMGAAGAADDANRFSLFNYASFLYNSAPRGCYGSPEDFKAWKDTGGIIGLASVVEDGAYL